MKCRTCKKDLTLQYFYSDKRRPGKLVPDCKTCFQRKKRINARFKRRFGITVLNYKLNKTNFALLFPQQLKEWNYSKNNKLNTYPEKLFQNSTKKVWWTCKIHGDYKQSIVSRTKGSGCNLCGNLLIAKKVTQRSLNKFGDLKKTYPDLFEEVDFDFHSKEEILNKSIYTHEIIKWKCKKCGNKWSTSMKNRTLHKSNCRKCMGGTVSRIEYRLYCELKSFFKSVFNSYKVYKKKYADIYVKDLNLIIEYDSYHFHHSSLEKDFVINNKIKELKYNIIRIRENGLDKINDKDIILKKTDNTVKNQIRVSLLLTKSIRDNFKNKLNKKALSEINTYLKNKKFLNNKKYNDFISCLPYPPVQDSIEFNNPRAKLFWDYDKNSPLKPFMFRKNDKTFIWIKCSKNHSERIKVFDLNRRLSRKSYKNQICRFC